MADQNTITLKVKRQDSPDSTSTWEEFSIPYTPNHNIISVLQEVQKNPVNKSGQKTAPVVWDCNCLEEVCGACSMVINGQPRQACTALIDVIGTTVTLEPLEKFPVIRDLWVDRQSMFDSLIKVKAWVPIDGTHDMGEGPLMSPYEQEWAYELSKCMTCGCCMDSCPQFNDKSAFIGPSPIQQVRLFNAHPTGAYHKEARLDAIMAEGGISECGNAQNCVQVCPKEIPITTSLAALNRQVTKQGILGWLGK